jgi:pyruvate/2-oxoglutarate dehydrogenase complex dihydrolipoamide acyltransferase (E2) component
MATELKVPTLGMDMEEATIVRWLVEEGAEVTKGEPILEIDTDKTSFEIEAPADGAIRALRGDAGETLPVGATLAYITAPGEEVPEAPAEDVRNLGKSLRESRSRLTRRTGGGSGPRLRRGGRLRRWGFPSRASAVRGRTAGSTSPTSSR